MRVFLLLALLLNPVFSHATSLNLDEGGRIWLDLQGFLIFEFGGVDTATGVHYNAFNTADALVFPVLGGNFVDGLSSLQYSATSLGDSGLFLNDSDLAVARAGGSVVPADFFNLAFFGSVPVPPVFPDGSFTITAPGFFSGRVTPVDFSKPDLRGTTYTFSAPTLTTASFFMTSEGQHLFSGATAILTPEPSTWLLLLSGLALLLLITRRTGGHV